jgi:hypothetical protein
MDLSVSIDNNVYIHKLGGRTVRSSTKGGGGSINSVLVTGGNTIDVKAYVSQACTVRGSWQIVRIK